VTKRLVIEIGEAGIDFEELVWRVLETSFARTRK